MSIFDPNNPGIGGIDELTDAEELLVQQLASLGDPNADRLLFWDDSEGTFAYLTLGTNLYITGTTLNAAGGSSGGAVDSVNGQVGTVVLDADDIDDTATFNKFVTAADISKLSGIEANANNYTHPATHSADIITDGTTNKAYTAAEKTKLAGIAEGANNYTHPATHSADIITDGTTNKTFTETEKTKLAGIATGAEVNVNADWNAVSGDAQILNKPTLGDAATKNTGTTAGTVAAGNHNHSGTYEPAGAVSDTAYDASWNGDTTHAPSKNAVYNKIEAMSAASGISAELALAYSIVF